MKLVSHKELHNEWMQDDEYRVVVGIAVTGYLPRATVNAKIVGRFWVINVIRFPPFHHH
ncbi:TPA: hypothetical protein ACS509_004780 [Salmonella enterica]